MKKWILLSTCLNSKKSLKKEKNEKHPALKEEERITDILKSLRDDDNISETLYESLRPRGSQTGY